MPRPVSVLPRVGFGLMALLSLPLALLAYGYLFGLAPPDPVAANRVLGTRILTLHATLGATALLLGLLQFIPRLRNGYPTAHRWIGRSFAVSCLLGGASGLVLALGASTGPVTSFGFGTLSLLWIGTTAMGWRLARQGRYSLHHQWMTRAYAVTFAFVTFRLELQTGVLLGLPFETSYQISSILCWVTNLLAAELILRRNLAPRRRAVPA